MFSPREGSAREVIHQCYNPGRTGILNIHTVTFQPRGNIWNDDRVVVESWDLFDHRYLFLAVFDDHASKNLPRAIRRKLRADLQSIGGCLDRGNINQRIVQATSIIKHEIEKSDMTIGDALQQICPRPWELSEEQARRLIDEHKNVVKCAYTGTTVAFALVNLNERFMWAAGVGDSSVGISIVGEDDKRRGQRLCDLHSFTQPQEYYRATMAHSSAEQPLFEDGRILGWIGMRRAIGDFALKLHPSYTSHLFQCQLWLSNNPPPSVYIPKLQKPPYLISEPSVRFTDLRPFWDTGVTLFLFTDGVNNLVDGYYTFTPGTHSGADPIQVVAQLLADEADPGVEKALGHTILPRWSMERDNRALDVLGNLLGGRDVERLEMVTDVRREQDIDDTTIIVWPLSSSTDSSQIH